MVASFHAAGLIYPFAALLAVFVAVTIRRLSKPSCRVCIFRGACPNRKTPFLDRGGIPCYERDLESNSDEPRPARQPRSKV
jgi:hypothetical protein